MLAVGLAQPIQLKPLKEKDLVLVETEPLAEAVVVIIIIIATDQCIMVEKV